MQGVGTEQGVVTLNGEVSTLVKQGERCFRLFAGDVELVLSNFHTITCYGVDDGEMLQMFYQRGHRARLEPVVAGGIVVKGIQQAEWRVDILAVGREMVSVVVLLQQGVCLLCGDVQVLRIFPDTGTQRGIQFFLRDTTKTRIFVKHGYLLEVVQFGEDAELRKFSNSCDEHESEVCPLVLQDLIELAEHGAHGLQLFRLVHQSHDGGVVFVEYHDYLLARLFEGPVYESTETLPGSLFRHITSIDIFIVADKQFQCTLRFGNGTILQSAHGEVEDGMLLPFLFEVHDLQSLEEFLLSEEIRLEGVAEQ